MVLSGQMPCRPQEGYLARQPLTAAEAQVLFPLMQCRLAQSLVMGADSAQQVLRQLALLPREVHDADSSWRIVLQT